MFRGFCTCHRNSGVFRRYVHGPGIDEPLLWYEGAGTGDKRWLHADERGSIVGVSDGAGATIAVNSYDEYGNPAPGNVGAFGYTGQLWMPELGMWYYKARMYSPALGRFMQSDPIGYRDGMNWYNYVGGDPVNFVDPLGLELCPDGSGDICSTAPCPGQWACGVFDPLDYYEFGIRLTEPRFTPPKGTKKEAPCDAPAPSTASRIASAASDAADVADGVTVGGLAVAATGFGIAPGLAVATGGKLASAGANVVSMVAYVADGDVINAVSSGIGIVGGKIGRGATKKVLNRIFSKQHYTPNAHQLRAGESLERGNEAVVAKNISDASCDAMGGFFNR